MSISLTNTQITIDGAQDQVDFTNLSISQALADAGSFAFTWRQQKADGGITGYVDFYKQYLSKQVTITIQDFTFTGIITSISCSSQDDTGTQYRINGKGVFAKLDETVQCNSFSDKKLSDIFTTLNTASGTTLNLTPANTDSLPYAVQYNQTNFEFYRMLAARYGEWLYYDGNSLVLGPPSQNPVSLTMGTDLQDMNLSSRMFRSSQKNSGFDTTKGTALQKDSVDDPGISDDLIQAGYDAGDQAYENSQSYTHLPNAITDDMLGKLSDQQQQAELSKAATLTGRSSNSQLNLAARISVSDATGNSLGEYIITRIDHFCASSSDYENHFMAAPSGIKVPPYTNPHLHTVCRTQPAVVTDNEDSDGLSRIKVRFPWQASSDSTPWISVMVPHAGKDKGFHFLPEKNEEVMIGFINNNAERPFVIGAFYTQGNKSGVAVAGNDMKSIGTKGGRRLDMNDKEGYVSLADNFAKQTPKNIVYMSRGGDLHMEISSLDDADNRSSINMQGSNSLEISLISGGAAILSIKMEKSGQKMTIMSKGSIEMTADESITMSAPSISIKASKDLNLEGTNSGVDVKGKRVTMEADTDISLEGDAAKITGDTKLDIMSSGIASVQGLLVKIN